MSNISVGISDWKVSKAPDVLVTYALGSCVGICLLDKVKNIGGLSHIMLPDSGNILKGGENRMKFADTAIPDMYHKLLTMGAIAKNITAKITGGALMFATSSERFNIGERNVDAVKKTLQLLHIPILAYDTGKNYGRTIFFHLDNGSVEVKSTAFGVVVI
ncbi:MAG: chemotaxis protein CheD [Eubacterium sp.]|jgi:chemotaxis protein CheD|nr:chemotaxis protein CheD [Eubacterium sp.]